MAQITLNSSGVASNGTLALQSNGTTTAVTIDTSQRVGVGLTPSPTSTGSIVEVGDYSKLSSSGTNGGTLANNAYYNSGWKYFGANFATLYQTVSGQHRWLNAPSGTTAGDAVTFTQVMTLTTAGNLGIGTTSPINNGGYGGLSLNGTSGALFSMMTNGTETTRIASIGDETSIQCKASTGVITFVSGVSGGTERARIDSSGNLLVGTTGAGARVYAVASGSQQAIRGDQSTAGAAAIYGLSSVNSGTGYVAYFTNTGSSTGLYISNTAAWQSTSDARLKTDVKDLDSTAKLLQLRPVDYLWKSQETSDEPTKRNLGFIAQEVKEVFPELVGVSPDGMFSVEYTGLIAPLVKAIQEQQALITQLQADVAALKA